MQRSLFLACAIFALCLLWVWSGNTFTKSTQTAESTGRKPLVVPRYVVPPPPRPDGSSPDCIVITGGAGFIGSQLAHHLHHLGHEVIIIDNMVGGYDDNLVVDGKRFGTFIKADVRDPGVRAYLIKADYILHFAATTALPVCQDDPPAAIGNNVDGLGIVLEAARQGRLRRVLFASTSAVYENTAAPVLTEDLAVSPHLIYSLTKHQGEMLCGAYVATYGVDVVTLRFFNVFGPHQDFRRTSPPLTSHLVHRLLNRLPPTLHGDGRQRRDYVYVSDLHRFVLAAMRAKNVSGEVFNVASGKAYSVLEILRIVQNLTHTQSIEPIFKPAMDFWVAYPKMFKGTRPLKRWILEKEVNKFVLGSHEKATRLLGWRPEVTMEEGLRAMVNYLKSHPEGIGNHRSGAWS